MITIAKTITTFDEKTKKYKIDKNTDEWKKIVHGYIEYPVKNTNFYYSLRSIYEAHGMTITKWTAPTIVKMYNAIVDWYTRYNKTKYDLSINLDEVKFLFKDTLASDSKMSSKVTLDKIKANINSKVDYIHKPIKLDDILNLHNIPAVA